MVDRSPKLPPALVPQLSQSLLPSELFQPTRLVLPANLAYEAWEAIGNLLAHMHGALQWWWSDWILAGLDAYGEEAPSAQALADRQYGTIANWIYVGRMFEPSRRREKLTWGHHYEVARFKLPGHTKTAPLPDVKLQDKWLDLAEQHRWSVRELREEVAKACGRRPLGLQEALARLDAAVRAVMKRWPEGEEAHEALSRKLCALGEEVLPGGALGASTDRALAALAAGDDPIEDQESIVDVPTFHASEKDLRSLMVAALRDGPHSLGDLYRAVVDHIGPEVALRVRQRRRGESLADAVERGRFEFAQNVADELVKRGLAERVGGQDNPVFRLPDDIDPGAGVVEREPGEEG